MDEYLEGYDDALKSVPIVSAEYAALERERDELRVRIAELEQQLRDAIHDRDTTHAELVHLQNTFLMESQS